MSADATSELRTSPLDAQHTSLGAQFTDFGGWRMPLRYGSELDEHRAVRERAGLFDLSHMAEIAVRGAGAGEALDAALAGRLSALALGQAKYSLLLEASGGILDDVIVYRTGDEEFLVVANAANRGVAVRELVARADGYDAEVEDRTDVVALIALQGPAAVGVLRALPGFAPDGGAEALDALKYYRALTASWAGHELLVARTGYTGEDGFELYVDAAAAPELWAALLDAGADAGVVPAGLASRDTLRLEAGMPLYGHELDVTTLPEQAGLGRVVALATKGDFTGRAGVEAAAPAGRVLVGLVSEGRRAGRAGYPVLQGDVVVGEVTSGALSPTLGHPIAMAYVDRAASEPGTELALDVRGTRLPAAVSALPFYRRTAS